MENITVKISEEKYANFRKEKSIFGWEVIRENKLEDHIIEVTMVRDDSVSYYQELITLEKEYNSKPFNFLPLIVVSAILAIALLTVFVVFNFIVKDVIDNTLKYAFLFVGMGLTVSALVICFLFSKRALSPSNDEQDRDKLYIEKVEELKKNG